MERARKVARKVRGTPVSDGAGVRMTRLMGTPQLEHFDPFLMLDELHSDNPNDYLAGFPDHPHRGFETVTYMLAGRMKHGDNQGNTGLLGPGSVQWMTAGRGIVHSELPQQEAGLMWGFQLWVNLPSSDKLTEPRYQDIQAEGIPETDPAEGVHVRVVAGELGGVTGPVSGVATEPVFYDLAFEPGAAYKVPLPEGHNAFVYVFQGSAAIPHDAGSEPVERGEIALLTSGDHVALEGGSEGGRLMLVAGRPLNEPVARYGPFVMNTREELYQAFEDYRDGRL